MKRGLKIFGILVTLLLIVLFIFSLVYRNVVRDYLASETESFGIIAVSLFMFLSDLIPQYVGPHFILVNGLLVGLPKTSLIIFGTLGALLGSYIGFEIGARKGYWLASDIYGEDKLQRIHQRFGSYGKIIILIAALSPLPYLPILFGTLNMSRKSFFLYGMLPRAVSLVLIGIWFYDINLYF